MKLLVILLLSVVFFTPVVAKVYSYKNEQGVVVFSDVPQQGAKAVEVSPVMTYPSTNVSPASIKQQQPDVPPQPIPYTSLTITNPQQEATIRDNQGIVNVTFMLKPRLKKGDSVEIYLDSVKQESLRLEGIERGEHTVRLQVVDSTGYALITSEDVIFYLRHQSKLF